MIVRLSDHPRALAGIRRARGWGGLAGFVLALVLSLRAGVPASDALVRALVAGLLANLAAWVIAIAVWRQLALAELETARQRRELQLAAASED